MAGRSSGKRDNELINRCGGSSMTYRTAPTLVAVLIQDRHHESRSGSHINLVPLDTIVIDDTKIVTKCQFR